MTLPLPSWLSPTGGLLYHLRALKSASRNWAPFRHDISNWLKPWLQSVAREHGELLIVGPSAGYSLERGIFEGFKRVVAVEPDPIARAIFAKRHGFKPGWITEAALDPELKQWRLVLDLHPRAAILFCNLLGQLYLRPDYEVAWAEDAPSEWRKEFQSLLAPRAFASYHDRLSGHQSPDPTGISRLHHWTSNEVLIRDHYAKVPVDQMEELGLADHRTEHIFDTARSLEFKYWVWRLHRENHHLIEGVSSLGL